MKIISQNNWSTADDFEVFDERDLFNVIAYLIMSLGDLLSYLF